MKKDLINSVVFIAVCSMLLLVSILGLIVFGITIYKGTGDYSPIIIATAASIVLMVGGLALIKEVHEELFNMTVTTCEDCNTSFEMSKVEKQVEYTIYGRMYVDYKCPHCKTSLF